MSQKIYPMIWSNNNAAEMANWYLSVFQNARILSSNDWVNSMEIEWFQLAILNGGPEFAVNPSISFFVTYDNKDTITQLWDKLIDGGMALMPLQSYPRSEHYGWVQDRYWVNRQLFLKDPKNQIINPSLMFTGRNNGKAQEAIDFYTWLFKNSSFEFADHYKEGDGDTAGHIKYASFTLDWVHFTAMDSWYDHKFQFTEWISLVVDCDGQEEVDYLWNNLTANGGEESQCGWLKDKYWVSWQITPHQLIEAIFKAETPEKWQYAMNQMMKMKKIVIEDLYQK